MSVLTARDIAGATPDYEAGGIEFVQVGTGYDHGIACLTCNAEIDMDGESITAAMNAHAEEHVDCWGCDATPLAPGAFMARLYADGGPVGNNPLVPFCTEGCYERALERGGMAQASA